MSFFFYQIWDKYFHEKNIAKCKPKRDKKKPLLPEMLHFLYYTRDFGHIWSSVWLKQTKNPFRRIILWILHYNLLKLQLSKTWTTWLQIYIISPGSIGAHPYNNNMQHNIFRYNNLHNMYTAAKKQIFTKQIQVYNIYTDNDNSKRTSVQH